MSRDRDLLPGLRTLGDRLGDAAEHEIAAEHAAGPRRRRRAFRPLIVVAVVATLAGAGAVTATDIFTGTGDPIQDEPGSTAQPGVLTDSSSADPGGGLPWALRVFVDDRGRECLQLGRLRDGKLGIVLNGQFRPFAGRPQGSCGDLAVDKLISIVETRPHPARTTVYGITQSRSPLRISLGGSVRTVRPGALGAYVTVYAGMRDLSNATISTEIDGRRITRRLGR